MVSNFENLESSKPWIVIRELMIHADPDRLEKYLEDIGPRNTARAISRLTQEEQSRLMVLLDPEDAADLLSESPKEQAIDLIEDLEPIKAAEIVEEMDSDDQADLLAELDSDEREAILVHLEPSEARDIRELISHPEDTAGGLMITEFLEYNQSMTIKEVLKDFYENGEEYNHYEVQYVYIVDDKNVLKGVIRLKDLLLAKRQKLASEVMSSDILAFNILTPLDKLVDFFDSHSLLGIPIIDDQERLVGIVRGAAVRDAAKKSESETFLKSSGIIGGEEFRTLPLATRSYRRLSWLSVNVVLNILSASVIALHQDTLKELIALAVFLPIVSDLSGCSGNQSVAVSIRELSLKLITPKELAFVLKKEVKVGIINGLFLGLILGLFSYIWKDSIVFSLVIACSLFLNVILAVCLGGSIPLILKRFKVDPALASSPILTTITDMCGFFLILQMATWSLKYL